MPHEVTEIKAESEANEAQKIAFDLADTEVQVMFAHFTLLKALMAEQIVALLALDELHVVFHSSKQVLYSVSEVHRSFCYKFVE
jgi:hypothetical protein